MKDYLGIAKKLEQILGIKDVSLHELNEALRTFPKDSGEVQRMYAEVTKEVNRLTTSLKIITAEMVEQIVKEYEEKGTSVSFASKDVIRKAEVPLKKEWQKVQKELDEASTQQTYLFGLCMSMNAKSHRLTELIEMATRYRHDELFVPASNKKFEEMSSSVGMDMER